jgi:hypothetical protein
MIIVSETISKRSHRKNIMSLSSCEQENFDLWLKKRFLVGSQQVSLESLYIWPGSAHFVRKTGRS